MFIVITIIAIYFQYRYHNDSGRTQNTLFCDINYVKYLKIAYIKLTFLFWFIFYYYIYDYKNDNYKKYYIHKCIEIVLSKDRNIVVTDNNHKDTCMIKIF